MDKKSYQNWLDNLQIGDEVLIPFTGRVGYGKSRIATIKRFTPSRMISLSNGTMINKDGSIRGYNHFHIRPVTDKDRYETKRVKLLQIVRDFSFAQCDNQQLKEIIKIVESSHKK